MTKEEKEDKKKVGLEKRMPKWKRLFKKEERPKVNVSVAKTNLLAPIERDKSRFFKEEWEDAKEQFFFSP